jgi:multidrug transporter EmrE-like cation transporter
MILQNTWFWWLVASSICFAGVETLFKIWATNNNWKYIPILLFLDICSCLLCLPAINHLNKLIVVGIIWSVLSVIITASIGSFFGEKIEMRHMLGICCGILAIILIGGE